jgi:hypothetical protein
VVDGAQGSSQRRKKWDGGEEAVLASDGVEEGGVNIDELERQTLGYCRGVFRASGLRGDTYVVESITNQVLLFLGEGEAREDEIGALAELSTGVQGALGNVSGSIVDELGD